MDLSLGPQGWLSCSRSVKNQNQLLAFYKKVILFFPFSQVSRFIEVPQGRDTHGLAYWVGSDHGSSWRSGADCLQNGQCAPWSPDSLAAILALHSACSLANNPVCSAL